jgi:Mrp family chromosome partitioning ATPase
MSSRRRRRGSGVELSSAPALALEQRGDVGDGSLVIQDLGGRALHYAAPEITAGLRHLMAKLQVQDKGGIPERLAVTSALTGEGVTFVARSLAAVLANDLDRRTCLVDLNWWSGTRAATGRRTGMAGVLTGESSLEEAIVRTANPRLALVPAGDASVSERPVLARTERLGEVLEELAGGFDHVLLDLPAVLKNGEALTLAAHSEKCILVVRHGVTSESYVQAALADLSDHAVLGIVMNRSSTAVPERILRLVAPL